MGTGEERGEIRGLKAAGDRDRDRDSVECPGDGGSRGAGDPGESGGEGVPDGNFLDASSPGTFTVKVCFVLEDL